MPRKGRSRQAGAGPGRGEGRRRPGAPDADWMGRKNLNLKRTRKNGKKTAEKAAPKKHRRGPIKSFGSAAASEPKGKSFAFETNSVRRITRIGTKCVLARI